MTGPASLDDLAASFAQPGRDARPWAFWFLNDDTPLAELTDQLDAFAEAGFGTVCPCARIGLSETIGYLTDGWWELMRGIVAHCAALGLRVVLYDEASYPSGAANGLVVAEDPAFASRCLVPATVDVTLAAGEVRYARPALGRSLWERRVATVLTPAGGVPRLVEPDAAGLVRLDAADIGAGEVRVSAFFDCPSGGTIRGAHAWQDDGSPLAPASADLMNPDAVACFLRLTHDAYAAHLGAWFGDTVMALFTDEPSPLGRGSRADGIDWTPGFEADLAAAAGTDVATALAHLGEVFVDGSAWQEHHHRAVADRVARVWYVAQRDWCDAHGLALTGHPERPDEVAALDAFTWPGQDTVWRFVLPGPTALTGDQSTAPRTASSAAVLRRLADPADIAPVVNEVYGAYGWGLALDEVKWIADWLSVRGTTDFLLHALFASVRANRAFESEPDVGLHNAWWPHLPHLLTWFARTTLLNTALVERPAVAVTFTGDRVPADEVAPLYEHQVGFVYAPITAVPGAGFDAVVCLPRDEDAVRAALPGERIVVAAGPGWWESLPREAPPVMSGRAADLRVRAGTLAGTPAMLLTNEGEEPLDVRLDGTLWDAWAGSITPCHGVHRLERRASVWVSEAAPSGVPSGGVEAAPSASASVPLSEWTSTPTAPVGDWTRDPAWETFAGTVTYTNSFDLDAPAPLVLDLGAVGDLAEVSVNGRVVAHLFWAPYWCVIPSDAVRAGRNELSVTVSNSSANRWEGALRPSGLIGPVTLHR